MNEKIEKLIILGGAGSGKDFLMRKLVEKDLNPCLKTTTRPPRDREIQGVAYDFVSDSTFEEMIRNEELLCYQKFNVTPENKAPEIWYYGVTKEEFKNSQIFIMTPGEFQNVTTERRKGCFVVYIDIDIQTRRNRLIKRNDNNDSVERRLSSDERDFKDFDYYDLKITDPDFDAQSIFDLMF